MLSFSQQVKNELCSLELSVMNNKKAELAGILLLSSELVSHSSQKFIKLSLSNNKVTRRAYNLLKEIIPNTEIEILYKKDNFNSDNYNIQIENTSNKLESELDIDFFFSDEFPKYLKSVESKLSFIRGIFLSRGTITNPQKSYNLTISTYDNEFTDELLMLLREFGWEFKKLKRSRNFQIYLKKGDMIGDFLRSIGSFNMMYELENIRIIRDARNYATRTSNFDNANINKIIATSSEVIDNILVYKNTQLYKEETERNKIIIKIRVERPELSLQQISNILFEDYNFKASKSTISNLFKKIKVKTV